MRNRTSIDVIAVMIACGALATILFSALPPGVDRALHQATGKVLAQEALRTLPPGGQITVISRDPESFRQPAVDILLASFTREIRGAGAVMAGTHLVQVDPLRPVEVPSGDFYELLRRAPAEHVIVSFLGPPLLTEQEWTALGRVRARVIAFCPGTLAEKVDLRQLFDAGLLYSAVVGRAVLPGGGETAPGAGDAFGKEYVTLTAKDLSQLPPRLGAAR